MLKKTIKFKDLDGNQLEEDFYFNLSKAELAEMELTAKGGMQHALEQMSKEEDGEKILALLKNIVKKAYGVRSSDGRRFIKSEEEWENFLYSDAYDELLFELFSDSVQSAAFMRGLVPAEISEKVPADLSQMSPEEARAIAIEAMQGHKKSE